MSLSDASRKVPPICYESSFISWDAQVAEHPVQRPFFPSHVKYTETLYDISQCTLSNSNNNLETEKIVQVLFILRTD